MQLGTGEPLIERAGGRFDVRFSGVSMVRLFFASFKIEICSPLFLLWVLDDRCHVIRW